MCGQQLVAMLEIVSKYFPVTPEGVFGMREVAFGAKGKCCMALSQ